MFGNRGQRLGMLAVVGSLVAMVSASMSAGPAQASHLLQPVQLGGNCAETGTVEIDVIEVSNSPPYGKWEPNPKTVSVGTTITFKNQDDQNHQVASIAFNNLPEPHGYEFASPYDIVPDATQPPFDVNDHYQVRPCATGTWNYWCPLCVDPNANCHHFQGNFTAS